MQQEHIQQQEQKHVLIVQQENILVLEHLHVQIVQQESILHPVNRLIVLYVQLEHINHQVENQVVHIVLLEHIYEQFYRGDTAKRYEGTGLGLSLVQRIIHLHDGKIKAESKPGEGSCFTVILPIKTHK